MFTTKVSADCKSELLNKSRVERERRETQKQQYSSAIVLQKHTRRYLSNKHLVQRIVGELESLSETTPAGDLLDVFSRVLYVSRGRLARYHGNVTSSPSNVTLSPGHIVTSSPGHVVFRIIQLILSSMECGKRERWYVALAISKSCKVWLSQVQDIMTLSLEDLRGDVNILTAAG